MSLFSTSLCYRLHPHAAQFQTKAKHYYSTSNRDPFKVLFFGRDEFSCIVLEHLHAAQDIWHSIAVATNPDIRIGRRGSKLSVSPLKLLSERLQIPLHTIPPDKPSFRHWQLPPPFTPTLTPPPSYLLVTASFGRILSSSHLNVFSPGRRLNVHPSLLPAYRGAAPIQHAILDGQKEAGVCIIEMMERKKGIDAGDVWGKTQLTVPENADFRTLHDELAHEGGRLLVQVLKMMLAGTAVPTPQPDDPNAPRAPLLTPADSLLDFETMTAAAIVRRHRAISHQRPLYTFLRSGKTLQLHQPSEYPSPASHLNDLNHPGMAKYDPHNRALVVRCAGDSFLLVSQIKQQDRVSLKAKEWWNGVRPEDRASFTANEGPILFISSPLS